MAELVIRLVNGELAGKTAQSIAKEINAAGTAARKAEVGTKAWIDAHERLNKAKALQEDLRKQVNATTAASDKLKEAWNKLPGAQYFNQIGDSIGLVKGSVGGLTSGFKILKVAIAATGLGLLLVLAGSLVTYFSKFQSGIDLVSETFAGLKAVVNEVIGRLGTFAQGLFEILSGNFSKGFETMSKSVDGLGESIKVAFNEGRDIERATKALERFARTQQVVSAQLTAQAEKDKAIADDATRSFAEREAAAARARKASADAARIAIDLARRELDVVNRQVAQAEKQGLINDDLAQKQVDAQVKMIEAEKNLTQVMLENEKVRRELKQDRLERDLDILIDGFDNVKTVNEKILNDETRTFDERSKLLEDLRDLAEGSFNEQVQTIQQFTGKQVDAMDLLNTADAKQLNNKIRSLGLSEIIEGRLLEMIRERRTALADFAEFEQALEQQRVQAEEERRAKELQDRLDQHELDLITDQNLLNERFMASEITEQQFRQLSTQNVLTSEQEKLQILRAAHGEQSAEYQKAYANFLSLQQEAAKASVEITRKLNEEQMQAAMGGLQVFGNVFGAMAGMYEQGTEQWKAMATAQAVISTIQGSINAYTSTAAIPIVGPTLAPFAAGLALAAGYKSVQKIQSTEVKPAVNTENVQKKELGGPLEGPSHRQGGILIEAEGGEFIFSRKAVRALGVGNLSRINDFYTRKFASGGPVNPFQDRAPISSGRAVGQSSAPAALDGSVANKMDHMIALLEAWPRRLKVVNVVTETQEAIDVVNTIRIDADV